MVKIGNGKPKQIRFTEEQLVALDALSIKSGHSIAALVRWCVEKSLPTLTANLEASVKASEGK